MDTDQPKTEWHRQLRIATQEYGAAAALARHCGVTQSAVTYWRAGKHPGTSYLWRVEEHLGIDPRLIEEPPKSDETDGAT